MSSAPGMCQAYPNYTSDAPEDVLGFSRVAPELSHLSSKVATQSSTTRAARRRSRDAPCLASAGAQAMFGVIKNGRW